MKRALSGQRYEVFNFQKAALQEAVDHGSCGRWATARDGWSLTWPGGKRCYDLWIFC